MIGKKLKLARQGSGLSLRELESKIGNLVSAQAIGKYERDEMMPSSTILIVLAKAMGVSVTYLLSQNDLQLEGIDYRKKKITSKKEEAHVSASVISHVERYLEVEDIINSASIEWDQPRDAPFLVHSLQDAEFAAEKLRYYWRLGTSPITNLAEFLEERGIKVLSLPLATSISGLTCFVKRRNAVSVPVIVINENHKGDRQRFTLAHELGHLILDVSPNVNEESAANRFSGAFLAPADILRTEIGKHRNNLTIGELLDLKALFGVSIQGLAYRCKDLEIISSKVFQSLFAEFSRRGWRTPPYDEPLNIPKEKPSRFERLCFRAVAEEAINEVKAAELLGITVREFKQNMENISSSKEK
jgi:Zn-dependent peptidase ImmA (M78 family)/DNA-binding XRE family transcriptional regulator